MTHKRCIVKPITSIGVCRDPAYPLFWHVRAHATKWYTNPNVRCAWQLGAIFQRTFNSRPPSAAHQTTTHVYACVYVRWLVRSLIHSYSIIKDRTVYIAQFWRHFSKRCTSYDARRLLLVHKIRIRLLWCVANASNRYTLYNAVYTQLSASLVAPSLRRQLFRDHSCSWFVR